MAIRNLIAVAACILIIATAGCNTTPSADGESAEGDPVVSSVVVSKAEAYPTVEAEAEAEAVEDAVEQEAPTPDGPVVVEDMIMGPADRVHAWLDDTYRIGPRDVLEFRSLEDPDLNTPVVVRYDGFISLPWVDDVQVAGLTRNEAVEKVRLAYSQYYEDPQVTLLVRQANSKTFIVMGDVSGPGEFLYTHPITLLESLSAAGGLRVYQQRGDTFVGTQGQLIKALIIRESEEGRNITEYDLRGVMDPGMHKAQVPVMPGDLVFVPESVSLVYLLGETRAGVYALTTDMTMLQLLATAGGFVPSSARLKQVVLIRELDQDKSEVMLLNVREMLKTGQDFTLQPGDIIYIPRKPLVELREFIGRITGVLLPVMNLYQEAFDTYYTKERYDTLFEDEDLTRQTEVISVLQGIRDVGGLLATVPVGP